MAKIYKMNWRDQDNEELYRIVKNFNQKRDYHFRKSPEKRPYLPEKVSIKDIREDVTTRKDFKRIMNRLERFSRRGGEELVTNKAGTVLTKWKKRENKIEVAALNRKRTWQQKRLNIDIKEGNIKAAEDLNLEPFDVKKLDYKTPESLEKFMKGIDKQLKDKYFNESYELYKKNYIKGVKNGLGTNQEIMELVLEMDAEELYLKTAGNRDAKISVHYEPDDIQSKVQLVLSVLR